MECEKNNKGKLYIISGCSGVGKGTLLKVFLEKNPNISLSVSATTRSPREGEVDGVNYFFVSRESFENSIKNNEFIEWAEFNGNLYGTKEAYVEQTLNKGKSIILEIETRGAFQIKKKRPDAVSVFVLPPSLEELEHRLRGRNTEDETAIKNRLQEAYRELECSKEYDFRVVNDNLEQAVSDLEKIICN